MTTLQFFTLVSMLQDVLLSSLLLIYPIAMILKISKHFLIEL